MIRLRPCPRPSSRPRTRAWTRRSPRLTGARRCRSSSGFRRDSRSARSPIRMASSGRSKRATSSTPGRSRPGSSISWNSERRARTPFCFSAAFRSAAAADWPALIEANALAVALSPSAERRLETTAQGRAFVAAARAAWDCEPLRRLDQRARRAHRLSHRCRRGGKRSRLAAWGEPRGFRPRPGRQSRLRRLAPRADRADGRPEDSRRALAAHSRAGAGGSRREPRRPRRRGVSLRHRRHAAREPVFEAVPVMTAPSQPLRVGVGGPVGSGKTALMEQLCKRLRDELDIAAITNDIYTKEDARILVEAGALPPERIIGVETGGCPAYRDPRGRLDQPRRRFRDAPALRRSRPHPHRVRAATIWRRPSRPSSPTSRSMSSTSRAERKSRARAARA